MENKEYDAQRLEGAKQMTEKVYEFAKEADISIDSCEWDSGQEIVDRDKHTLKLGYGGKSSTGEFPDEWLADYPTGSNREPEALLKMMIRRLLD